MLLLSCELVTAQKVTGSRVWLTTIERDTVFTEHKYVHMGTLRDRMCVDVGYIFCLYKLQAKYRNNYIVQDFTMIGESAIGDKYSVRQVIGERGFIIWITNIDREFPHWMITTEEPVAK